jgi:SAM-dependent methyltransferase
LPPPLSDPYLRCKLCERADLRDHPLRKLIREVYSQNGPGSRLPFGRRPGRSGEKRERWETAMALHAFDLLGVVSDQAEVLAVGSALEPAVRWLTPRTRRVCHLAAATSPLQPDHVDASFGVILCSGAIERLAGLREARAAVRELHRVLRPGGVGAISTGFRLGGAAPGPPGRLLMDEAELRETILGDDLIWATASPLQLAASSPVVEEEGSHVWTSVHLLLVKPLYH